MLDNVYQMKVDPISKSAAQATLPNIAQCLQSGSDPRESFQCN